MIMVIMMVIVGCTKKFNITNSSATNDDRIILQLAVIGISQDLRDAVISFNNTNSQYIVNITDYSEYGDSIDIQRGLTRLNTEILSGRIPDILDVSGLPYTLYASRGYLTDLYPLIDADSNIERNSFLHDIHRLDELNGCLYRIFPRFYITTLVGNPQIVGLSMGWNMDEFQSVLEINPEADLPLGIIMTKDNFVENCVMYNFDEYVNIGSGTVSFNTPQFVRLIELSNIFPDINILNSMNPSITSPDYTISAGRQLLVYEVIGEFRKIQYLRYLFDGEIIFKGFPASNRDGHKIYPIPPVLAISENCQNKVAAWEFVRTILSEEFIDNSLFGFPITQISFNQEISEALTTNTQYIINGFKTGIVLQEDIDIIINLISSASFANIDAGLEESLLNIVREGVADYINGLCSAQEAAIKIQQQAELWISERS